MIREITVQELEKMRNEKADFLLLDVRDQFEYDICNLQGKLIPLAELPERLSELNSDQKIVVHCKGGGRSSRAVDFLQQNGFKDAYNLKGGISTWWREIDPLMEKY
jgi:adenylyltransferase/sulfurtransferase